VAGIVADWATYSATAVQLALGIKGEEAFFPLFLKILVAFVPTQLPLGLLEGFITSGVITLLLRRRPDLMGMIYGLRSQEVEA
jgi:cobalt/nickel transport system permease protein